MATSHIAEDDLELYALERLAETRRHAGRGAPARLRGVPGTAGVVGFFPGRLTFQTE
jgi:hypothetical protein